MDKPPPLYDTSQSCLIFFESLKILGVSLPYPSFETNFESCDTVEDILEEARYCVRDFEVWNGKFPLSFIQLCQGVAKRNSPLHFACEMGDLGKVKGLCVFSHIDVSNMNGETPLHVACRHGHEDICEYLMSEMLYRGDISRYSNFPVTLFN